MPKLTLLDPTKTGRQAEDLENQLRHLVVGQDEAIHQIVRVYQTHVAGLSPAGRPIGNFLFLGPTGSGKTRVVEATAESLLKNPRSIIKIDCAEFQHSHEIAKLIGSPPGYLGHRETHPLLSQEALNQHHTERVKFSFVLFDEIEKASDALWNLLLGILDKGVLTLGDNSKVDFSSAMVFLTSNLGATEMCALSNPRLGFHCPTSQEARAASQPFLVNVTDTAREFLLKEGTDFRYGARHLKRAIERLLVQPLSNLMASGQIRRGDCIRVSHQDGSDALVFGREPEAVEAWGVAGRAA